MVQAGVPAPIIDLVLRCTAKKPEGRPRSFTEVIAELAPSSPSVSPAPRRP